MRSASTSRLATASPAAATAPPANASAPESASHSACQLPTARSCSCAGAPSEDRRMSLRELRVRHRERRADRIALLRHRRRPAGGRLGHFAHFGLSEQRDVSSDLLRGVCGCDQRRPDLRDAPAIRVPREHGLGQCELLGVEADDLERSIAQRRERARGSAELCREPLAPYDSKRSPCVDRADEPAGGLQSERGRHRLLQERARGHRRRPVRAGERSARGGESIELGRERGRALDE